MDRSRTVLLLFGAVVGLTLLFTTMSFAHDDPPSLMDPNLFLGVHISDVHINHKHGFFERQFRKALHLARDVIRPQVVVISGDLTEGKTGLFTGGSREDEARAYRRILDEYRFNDSSILFDIRGNHDAFSVSERGGAFDFVSKWAVWPALVGNSRIYEASYGTKSNCIRFVAADFTHSPGILVPFVSLFGYADQPTLDELERVLSQSSVCNRTILVTHYPSNTIVSERTSQSHRSFHEIVAAFPITAHFCGHTHLMYMTGQLAFGRHLELELEDMKIGQHIRLFAVDHGIFTFHDFALSDKPEFFVTRPARFGEQSLLDRPIPLEDSFEISIVVFDEPSSPSIRVFHVEDTNQHPFDEIPCASIGFNQWRCNSRSSVYEDLCSDPKAPVKAAQLQICLVENNLKRCRNEKFVCPSSQFDSNYGFWSRFSSFGRFFQHVYLPSFVHVAFWTVQILVIFGFLIFPTLCTRRNLWTLIRAVEPSESYIHEKIVQDERNFPFVAVDHLILLAELVKVSVYDRIILSVMVSCTICLPCIQGPFLRGEHVFIHWIGIWTDSGYRPYIDGYFLYDFILLLYFLPSVTFLLIGTRKIPFLYSRARLFIVFACIIPISSYIALQLFSSFGWMMIWHMPLAFLHMSYFFFTFLCAYHRVGPSLHPPRLTKPVSKV